MPKIKGLKYNKNYTEEAVQNALKSVEEQGTSLREAARKFNVPRATLQFRKSSKFTKTSLGPRPVLTDQEEQKLIEWIDDCERKGFPRCKADVQAFVKQFLDQSPRDNPFVNNYPGEGWYKAFLRRHPNITTRTPEEINAANSEASEEDVKKWFKEIHTYLATEGYADLLDDPKRIYKGDETVFSLRKTEVLSHDEIEHASSKATVTVLLTCSADGMVTPPTIVFPYKRIVPAKIAYSVPGSWGIGRSDSGLMQPEVIYEYVANVLHPHLREQNVKFPIIYFLDGLAAHLSYHLVELCSRLGIILIGLYPNATRFLQPADVAAFKPIEFGWKQGVMNWKRNNMNDSLTKEKFACVLQNVIESCAKPETIRNGFRACGLYPFDPNEYSKCLGGNEEPNGVRSDAMFEETKILTFETFKKIVGPEKIMQFEEMNHMNANYDCDDFNLLYRLWKNFVPNSELSLDEVIIKTETNERSSPVSTD